jgi:isopropylmalate/homocitrate/citramalate synthase
MRKTVFKKLRAEGLIEDYNGFRKNLPPKLSRNILIWDETLRESDKTPGVFLTYIEKVRLAQMLDAVGVAVINLGFPGFSEEEMRTVKKISNESFESAVLVASARVLRKDVDACLGCGIEEIVISTPFNGLHLRHILKASREDVLKRVTDSVAYAKTHGFTVSFSLEDASRTPIVEIFQILEAALKAGADRIVVEDTVGIMRPLSTHYLMSKIRKGLFELMKKEVSLAIKCFNDFGMATANTLAAIEEGATYALTSVDGNGERAGLAPLEEVVMAVELLCRSNTSIDVRKLHRLSQLVEKTFTSPLPFHKSIVGQNAFSHASDEHVHGMLCHPLAYVPFPPELIGRQTSYYLGVHTGSETVEDLLELGKYEAISEQIDEIVKRVRNSQANVDKGEMIIAFYQIEKLMKELRKGLTEEDFWKIVKNVMKLPGQPRPPTSRP